MFLPTANPYSFKYLITGISGEGIKEVYLPEVPSADKILFKRENKFIRSQPSEQLKVWMDEFEIEREHDTDYLHPQQNQINNWEEQEFDRTDNGIFFWNNGVITYITGDYYKYLTQWQPLFGFPDYRETDKETFYWIKFWEEDPNSFGGTYNTCRREGKSTKMGFWITNRTSTNFKHLSGMQGEDNVKIQAFYTQMVIDPFYKLPYYSKPTYDTTTLQKKGIIFKDPPKRNKRRVASKAKVVLESQMDYRTSEANKYDQAKLHSYVMEEPGKTMSCSVDDRWKFVKPCLRLGKNIIGKSFLGTTCEFMDVTDKGGKAYKKLCYQSDYNKRDKLGRTISGMYAALMPADCVLEGFIDEHGIPMRKEALQWILAEREAVEDNPKDYSGLVRKFPLNWNEVFYVSTEKCEFNAKILQDRKNELMMNPHPTRKVDLSWEGGKRFSRIVVTDNPINGWMEIATLIDKDKWNNVGERNEMGTTHYYPKNNNIFRLGFDPIDHGVVVQNSQDGDEFISSRRSRPVLLGKRLYDSDIEGPISQGMLEQRAKEKYPYKTGVHNILMKVRPNDPNVLHERVLMVCWLLGAAVHIESSKPGAINWLILANCKDFLWQKYVPDSKTVKPQDITEGTPASKMITGEYTDAISTDVEYFGHTYPFLEVVEDDLQFDPLKTTEFDFTVAQGQLELACKMKEKKPQLPTADVGEYFHTFDRRGNVLN